MKKNNLNTGVQSAYKITPLEKCRFHKTITTTGSGRCMHSPADLALFHAVYPSTVISTRPSLPFPERSSEFRTYPRTDYMCGSAPFHSVNSEMDGKQPPPDIFPTATEQSESPINRVAQSQSSTCPQSPLAQHQDVPGLDFSPSDVYPSPPYPSPPLLRHSASYAAPQASLPHIHPPHMVYSSPPFVFHHHPGTPGREASLSHMAYASPSMMSMLRPHSSYQGASSDPTPSPHQTYGAGAGTGAPTLPVYPSHPTNPSHSLAARQASATSTGEALHPASYTTPSAYSPLRYATQPPFVYPPTSFVPAPPNYVPHYPPLHHAQPYSSPPGRENRGVWLYLPPGTRVRSFEQPGSQLDNPSPVPQNEDEQSQTRTARPRYPSPTINSPIRSRFGGAGDPRTEIAPSSLPTSSTSSHPTKTTETPPSSESRGDLPLERRSYHPKLPAHRSEWVMWVGNVPSDITPDDLRAVFNQPLSTQSSNSPDGQVYGGVSSIFSIARSNCAFVNFESESQLEAAIARFHGKPVRPDNPLGPRLVCRVRKRTDDLKAGVGGQRGRSMHVKWIKEQRERAKHEGANSAELAKAIEGQSPPSSISDDDGREIRCSSRSSSLASTNSSILSRYFPQRYFILKSLTQHNLDLSVQRKVWVTQQHNEEILDQAYRTSKDVFLIFSVNKSGEFCGYARMAGPILRSEDRGPWASRPLSPILPPAVSDVKGNLLISPPAEIVEENRDPHFVFPPEDHRVVEQSPVAISPSQTQEEEVPHAEVQVSSAPAELHYPHHRLSHPTGAGPSQAIKSLPFELSVDAPYRAVRDGPDHQAAHPTNPAPSDEKENILEHVRDSALQAVAEELTKSPNEGLVDGLGRPFRVDWIRTEHLSFFRTKHLRNPWNHGREIKISRDGTELEPSMGRQLLEEWNKRSPSPTNIPAASSPITQRGHGSKST